MVRGSGKSRDRPRQVGDVGLSGVDWLQPTVGNTNTWVCPTSMVRIPLPKITIATGNQIRFYSNAAFGEQASGIVALHISKKQAIL